MITRPRVPPVAGERQPLGHRRRDRGGDATLQAPAVPALHVPLPVRAGHDRLDHLAQPERRTCWPRSGTAWCSPASAAPGRSSTSARAAGRATSTAPPPTSSRRRGRRGPRLLALRLRRAAVQRHRLRPAVRAADAHPARRVPRVPHLGRQPGLRATAASWPSPTLAVLEVVDVLEHDRALPQPEPVRRAAAGQAGHLPDHRAARPATDAVMAMLWVLAYSDGSTSLLDIASVAGTDFTSLRRAAGTLEAAGLLARRGSRPCARTALGVLVGDDPRRGKAHVARRCRFASACGNLAVVHMRRLIAGAALAVAVAGLAACRTSPNVAAYVGDEQVTVSQLEAAVDARRHEDPASRRSPRPTRTSSPAGCSPSWCRRRSTPTPPSATTSRSADDDVRARIDRAARRRTTPTPSTPSSPQQGISREDVFENVRQQLLRQEIAAGRGQGRGPRPRRRCGPVRGGPPEPGAGIRFGYITVPDQATADAGAGAARPPTRASYARASPRSTPARTRCRARGPRAATRSPVRSPQGIAAGAAQHRVHHAGARGRRRGRHLRRGPVYPIVRGGRGPSSSRRPPTAARRRPGPRWSTTSARTSASTVNPRYGVLKDGQLVPDDGGVVDILGRRSAPATPRPRRPSRPGRRRRGD